MVVGQLAEQADLLVIGGGPGGYVAALRAAALGRSVVLVERDGGTAGLGGTCLRVGCIPSKALIELAAARGATRRFASRGLTGPEPEVDLGAFQQDKKRLIHRLSSGVAELLARRDVRVVAGTARLTAPNRVAVERDGALPSYFETNDVVVATGSRAVELPALPRDGVRVLDSTDVLALERVPSTVVMVGGGYIGLELACALHGLGARVTVVELAGEILPGVDPAVASTLHSALVARGIEIWTATEVLGDDGRFVTVRRDGDTAQLAADAVVVAVGRRPNSHDVGFDSVGVEVDSRGLVAVSPGRLAAPHLAVIGDLTDGPALAHKAMAEAAVAAETLAGRQAVYQPAAIPAVVYTDPEVALAGESESSAREAGYDVVVSTVAMTAIARSATMGERRGHARLVSDRDSGAVLGATLVGPHVSEVVAELVLAVEMGATVEDLASTVHAHPTISESVLEAAHLAGGSPVHVAG